MDIERYALGIPQERMTDVFVHQERKIEAAAAYQKFGIVWPDKRIVDRALARHPRRTETDESNLSKQATNLTKQ